MSEENNETMPAKLVDGESVITNEQVEKAAEVVKPVEAKEEGTAIKLPKEEKTGPGLGKVADGVVGSTQVKASHKDPVKPVPVKEVETVAIESTRNVFWDGVGKVSVGINLVSKEDAEKWLTRNHIKLVEPKKVAKEFNN